MRKMITAAVAVTCLAGCGLSAPGMPGNQPVRVVPSGQPSGDVQPPERLDVVYDIMEWPSLDALHQECADQGGTPGEWDGSDSWVCQGVDY